MGGCPSSVSALDAGAPLTVTALNQWFQQATSDRTKRAPRITPAIGNDENSPLLDTTPSSSAKSRRPPPPPLIIPGSRTAAIVQMATTNGAESCEWDSESGDEVQHREEALDIAHAHTNYTPSSVARARLQGPSSPPMPSVSRLAGPVHARITSDWSVPASHSPVHSPSSRSTTVTSIASLNRTSYGSRTLNQYEICPSGSLGSGRFGRVVKVRDTRDGAVYAMKIIHKSTLARSRGLSKARGGGGESGDARRTSRSVTGLQPSQAVVDSAWMAIRSEVSIMMRLDHPNIVRLIEVIDDPRADALYLVMEYAVGGSIIDELEPSARIELSLVREYFRQFFCGLFYLDSVGVIHRDIKPSNLLLSHLRGDALCQVKIADFGMSQTWEREAQQNIGAVAINTTNGTDSDCESPSNTRASLLVTPNAGSTGFLAPEQCGFVSPLCSTCSHAGLATDLWAAGISIFLCAFGSLPFYSRSPHELYRAIASDELRIPVVQEEWVNAHATMEDWDDLQSLVHSLLQKRACQRPSLATIASHPFLTHRGQMPALTLPLPSNIRVATEEKAFTVMRKTQNRSSLSTRALAGPLSGLVATAAQA